MKTSKIFLRGKNISFISLLLLIVPGLSTVHAQDGLDHRVAELSQQIVTRMAAQQKRTIAVVEFTDLQGTVTDFGRYLAEELITRLYIAENFKVIERQLLSKVIAEQKLSLSGVIDPASAKQLGKLLGVDAIVSGTITNLSQSVKVNARLISTETGEIFAVASSEIFKDESVMGLLGSKTPSSSKATPVTKGDTANRIIQNEFIIELTSCKRSLNNVSCFFMITNGAGQERRGVVSAGESKVIDEAGNEYTGMESLLGGRKNRAIRGSSYNDLLPQVPTQATIKFENVSSEAKQVTVLLHGGTVYRATFRNVKID